MSTVRIRVIVKAIEDVLAGKTVVVLSGRGIGWRDVRRGGPRRRQWSDYEFIDVDVINRCWKKIKCKSIGCAKRNGEKVREERTKIKQQV
jgi:hypothetical protein